PEGALMSVCRVNLSLCCSQTILGILDGKDVVAMARTGSGKTAAFLIPMFEKLKAPQAQTGAQALVLTPTRELALQTMKFTKEVCAVTALLMLTSGEVHRPENGTHSRWRQVRQVSIRSYPMRFMSEFRIHPESGAHVRLLHLHWCVYVLKLSSSYWRFKSAFHYLRQATDRSLISNGE
uniref:Helicase ATP-binding domain-containing protein n=1 Tax=Sinocyclocheilus grahami TaxID=75366 RepID=A0A672RHW0_SINGR